MWKRTSFACLVFVLAATTLRAQGMVQASKLAITVEIVEGVATTRLRMLVENHGSGLGEADWILPLAPGIVADDFRMRVAGVETRGEVLDEVAAREVYERIVRSRRDPGLLESLGRGCLRARVFPVPSAGTLEAALTYREVLPEVGGLRRWSFPLRAAGLDGTPPEELTLDLSLTSSSSLGTVFSPSRGMHVRVREDGHVQASYEGRRGDYPHEELALMFAEGGDDFGIDVLSTWEQGEASGSFLLSISPRRAIEVAPDLPTSITLALDVSGSMQGGKFEQAREAARSFLRSLDAGDHFNVVPYATDAEPFFPEPVEANEDNLEWAFSRLEALKALGGTNIDAALQACLSVAQDPEGRLPVVVLLTDGKPSVRETDTNVLLQHARAWNRNAARVFVFGVGDDVDVRFLDTLADQHQGQRTYVHERANVELAVAELLVKLSRPALVDVEVSVEGVALLRQVPERLPDLHHGGRLVLLGRYAQAGVHTLRVRGRAGDELLEFTREVRLSKGPERAFDFVPGLWAERRVGMLLDQMRLHGTSAELIEEVRALGVQHRIVTPYTSHLILEQGLTLEQARDRRAPSAPGAGGPASPGPQGPGTSGSPVASADFDESEHLGPFLSSLREMGVLPQDASEEELSALAHEVVREMRVADQALQGLVGSRAARATSSDSNYLSGLMNSGTALTGSDDFYLGRRETVVEPRVSLIERFSRRLGTRNLLLRAGVWTDAELVGLAGREDLPETQIESYSDAWFELAQAHPDLVACLSFSERLDLLVEGGIVRVRPAPRRPLAGVAPVEGETR